MKFVILLIGLVSAVLGAHIEERFLESVTGGIDIKDLALQLLSQFGCDETEAQCETQLCPQILNPIDNNNVLITSIVCAAVCKEAQILAKHYTSGSATGVDPCTGSLTGK